MGESFPTEKSTESSVRSVEQGVALEMVGRIRPPNGKENKLADGAKVLFRVHFAKVERADLQISHLLIVKREKGEGGQGRGEKRGRGGAGLLLKACGWWKTGGRRSNRCTLRVVRRGKILEKYVGQNVRHTR